MNGISLSNIRNFTLMGHTGSGKTSLVDALLFKLGVVDRKGDPGAGTSSVDWTDEEKHHKITIFAKPFSATYKPATGDPVGLNFIDTPGYADFIGQMTAASAVADAALILVDASSGIQVGTNRSWRRCEALGMPRAIAITGLDKDNTNFDITLASLQEVWGDKCVPVSIPSADGVVEVLGNQVPADVADKVSEIKGQLVELAAETDDALIEKYLGGEALTSDEIAAGLHGSVQASHLVPVFALSNRGEQGLDPLLEGIRLLFPAPNDRERTHVDGEPISVSTDGDLITKVWRTVNDPFVGQLTFLRVFSGTLQADHELTNASNGEKERVGSLYAMNGKKHDAIDQAGPGDIVALAKLKHTSLNDSLGRVVMPDIVFPNPVMEYAVTPKTKGDEDKLGTGLHRIADEDPTIRVHRNEATHELIMSGMGDVHLDIAVERLHNVSHVEVDLHTPQVAYKETITGNGEGHHKHKKQSGGRGQYGEVYLRVEPLPEGEEEWFVNKIVGGAIPGGFIPAVQKGLVEAVCKGAVAGYPVINSKVTLYDGSYHDVDSSEIAFKIAAGKAFRDAMSKAKPVLLEPIMKLTVMVPDQFMGDINGDLNHRRGRILGMGIQDGLQEIIADVPKSELFSYSSQLRSMTGGQGSFEVEFSRYEVVPTNVAQKIIAEAKHDIEED